jgi:hypothetical protein
VYAVGHRLESGDRTGVVLKFHPISQAFVEFPGPVDPDDVPHCKESLSDLAEQVLTQVEVTSNGDAWIAGTCGRVWQYQATLPTPAWREHKSQTNADVRGMMFLSPERGYLGLHGGTQTNQVVVRYREP